MRNKVDLDRLLVLLQDLIKRAKERKQEKLVEIIEELIERVEDLKKLTLEE